MTQQWQALDPFQRRQRPLTRSSGYLLRESQVQPLVLVFEDLHWIDSETQAMLESLVESLPTRSCYSWSTIVPNTSMVGGARLTTLNCGLTRYRLRARGRFSGSAGRRSRASAPQGAFDRTN